MAKQGGSSPGPFPQRSIRALYLRVPVIDWGAIIAGIKTEFRTPVHERTTMRFAYTPTPVVAYCVDKAGHYESSMAVLLAHRREPLIALAEDQEGLAREGYETFDHFRAYWRQRYGQRLRGLASVSVWHVRPWLPSDRLALGANLIDRLYDEWL